MSTNAKLPAGAFITSINGKRCTAVPRANGTQNRATTTSAAQKTTTSQQSLKTTTTQQVQSTSTLSTTSTTSTTSVATTTQSAAPPPPENPQVQVSSFSTLGPESSTTQVAVTPVVTTSSSTIPMGSFSTIPSSTDSNPGANTETQAQNTVPASSTATTSARTSATTSATNANESITNVISTTASSGSSVIIQTPLAENGGNSSTAAESALLTTPRTAAATGTEASISAGQPTVSPVANSSNTAGTMAIVGGVMGGVAVASLLVFLLLFWRRRALKNRRSTLLTPLSADPSFGNAEKGYIIDNGSVGPTPRVKKLRANISYYWTRVRGRLSGFLGSRAPVVNLNRGNSQFMEPLPQHSRSNSRSSSRTGLRGGKLTTKDRLFDWWDRLTEDVNFNWRLRNERNSPELDPFTAARDIKERNNALAASDQPDFLSLLGMDDKQLDRDQIRRKSAHGPSGSGSSEHFLGGLGLNFDGSDPFADVPRNSAMPAPLVVSGPDNPFADTNAIPSIPPATIPKPTTYVAEVRRSRGSVSAGTGPTAGAIAASGLRQYQVDSYRESLQSVESFATRRNKFRSDPFDLERPELLAGRRQMTSDSKANPASGEVSMPKIAHSRNDSFTSKYSSGSNFTDWGDPGPDVGPASTRWDDGNDGRDSPSGQSVGKAM